MLSDGKLLAGGNFQVGSYYWQKDYVFVKLLNDLVFTSSDFVATEVNALIYPNPVSGTSLIISVTSENPSLIKAFVTSTSGKVLSSIAEFSLRQGENKVELMLPDNLPTGCYLLKMKMESSICVLKFNYVN